MEVSDFDLALSILAFDKRVELHFVPLEQPLNNFVRFQFVLSEAQYLERLLFCDKSAFDSQAFLGNLLAALVAELGSEVALPLLVVVFHNFIKALAQGERADVLPLHLLLLALREN